MYYYNTARGVIGYVHRMKNIIFISHKSYYIVYFKIIGLLRHYIGVRKVYGSIRTVPFRWRYKIRVFTLYTYYIVDDERKIIIHTIRQYYQLIMNWKICISLWSYLIWHLFKLLHRTSRKLLSSTRLDT